MGRVVANVSIRNALHPEHALQCDALVDAGASHMVLPSAWRDRLGPLEELGVGEFETATQEKVRGVNCGPVRIQLEGFDPVHGDVVFVEMRPAEGAFDPLVGHIVLEQSKVAVDMVGHRLVPRKHFDLK